MPNPDSREMIQAADRLAEEFRCVREDLAARLEKAEEREREDRARLEKGRRAVHRLIGAVAALALMLAVAVGVFAWWNHSQDNVRAANHAVNQARDDAALVKIAALEQGLARTQQENTLFREHACTSVRDWQQYLADAPAGPPAGQRAAARLITSLESLCPKP